MYGKHNRGVNTSNKIYKFCTSQKPYGQGIFMDGFVTEKNL